MHLLGFFHYLDNIKLYHWTTTSEPRHIATDKLIEKMLPLVDQFIETYIGRYGREHFTNDKIEAIVLRPMSDSQAGGCVDAFINFIQKDVVARVADSSELQNITDEMLSELNQCKYRFTLE